MKIITSTLAAVAIVVGSWTAPSVAEATQPPAHCRALSVKSHHEILGSRWRLVTVTTSRCRGHLVTTKSYGPWTPRPTGYPVVTCNCGGVGYPPITGTRWP